MSRAGITRTVAAGLAAAALLSGLLALVQLVEEASFNPRAIALASVFGADTALLGAGTVVVRAPRVRAVLAVAGAGAAAAMTLAGALSFGSLFVPPFVLWLASAVLLCRAAHPRGLAVAAAAAWGWALSCSRCRRSLPSSRPLGSPRHVVRLTTHVLPRPSCPPRRPAGGENRARARLNGQCRQNAARHCAETPFASRLRQDGKGRTAFDAAPASAYDNANAQELGAAGEGGNGVQIKMVVGKYPDVEANGNREIERLEQQGEEIVDIKIAGHNSEWLMLILYRRRTHSS